MERSEEENKKELTSMRLEVWIKNCMKKIAEDNPKNSSNNSTDEFRQAAINHIEKHK